MPLTCPSNDNALSQVERSKRAVERAGTATGTARMHCGLPLLTARSLSEVPREWEVRKNAIAVVEH